MKEADSRPGRMADVQRKSEAAPPEAVGDAVDHPAKAITEALLEQGVTHIFGVYGGHVYPILDPAMRAGIFHITVRHEQSAGYAAEAYARIAGRPGVACATAGPGSTNLFSAVHQAFLSDSPVICLLGGHLSEHDRTYTLQECYAYDFFSSITKWSQRLTDNRTYKHFITKAFKSAMEPPCKPICLEFELNALEGHMNPSGGSAPTLYAKNAFKSPTYSPCAPPEAVERIAKLLFQAERPMMYLGEGVLWSKAAPEAHKLAKAATLPVIGRRGARGAVPEDDSLACRAGLSESDLVLCVGTRLDVFDRFGIEMQRVIQVNEAPEYLHPWLNTEVAINASPRQVLGQLVSYIQDKGLTPTPAMKKWADRASVIGRARKQKLTELAEKYKKMSRPVHGIYLCKVLWDTVEDLYGGRCPTIWDSFTGSNVLGPFVAARWAGQCIDAGVQAGVGHGVGQSIGAAFAMREKGEPNLPLLVMMGDAGMGVAGMDIETAVRHRLPCVYVVWNNDGWMPVSRSLWYGPNYEVLKWKGEYPPHEFLPNIRYDKFSEMFGCHGEWVDEPEKIRPALERCFRAAEKGQPAVCNVDVYADSPVQSTFTAPFTRTISMTRHIPFKELPYRGKAQRRRGLACQWDKYGIPLLEFDPQGPIEDEEWYPYSPQIKRPVPPWWEERMKQMDG